MAMNICAHNNRSIRRRGVALLFALIVLAVLTTFSYSILMRISARKSRLEYYIDYQSARYANASAVKYALSKINTLKLEYIDRSQQPDFSDLFSMNDDEYLDFLSDWAKTVDEVRLEEFQENQSEKKEVDESLMEMLTLFGLADANDLSIKDEEFIPTDPNSLSVAGPYGPEWPLIVKEEVLEIGGVEVTIRIEDENAKLPVTLAFLKNPKLEKEKEACFMTFFEWMGLESDDVDEFLDEAEKIADIKTFNFNIAKKTETDDSGKTKKNPKKTRGTKSVTNLRNKKRNNRSSLKQYSDFAYLIASYIDIGNLSKDIVYSEKKPESPLKYLAIDGSSKVNVNTAPRNVLEAIFSFGGDADQVADAIIVERKTKPFKSIAELKSRLFEYSDSINKTSKFLLTKSIFFNINIKSTVGSAVIESNTSVIKVGSLKQRIATVMK